MKTRSRAGWPARLHAPAGRGIRGGGIRHARAGAGRAGSGGDPVATATETAAPAVVEAAPAESAAPSAAAEADSRTACAHDQQSPTPSALVSGGAGDLHDPAGLALFYGGLVRSKNVLSILIQNLAVFSLVAVLWALYGYSLAFTEGNAFIGGTDRLFAAGLDAASIGATFTKGVYIPELAFFVFQGAFACITCALVVGAFAERVKFAGVMLFTVLWFTFAYLPVAHMVWFFPGPDAFTSTDAVPGVLAKSGYLWAKGALDFAGGTVVHINAAVAGLVGAYDRQAHRLRPRGDQTAQPHPDHGRRPRSRGSAGSASTQARRWKPAGWRRSPSSTPSSRRPRRWWPGRRSRDHQRASRRCSARPRARWADWW